MIMSSRLPASIKSSFHSQEKVLAMGSPYLLHKLCSHNAQAWKMSGLSTSKLNCSDVWCTSTHRHMNLTRGWVGVTTHASQYYISFCLPLSRLWPLLFFWPFYYCFVFSLYFYCCIVWALNLVFLLLCCFILRWRLSFWSVSVSFGACSINYCACCESFF